MFTIIGGDGQEYGPVTAKQIQEWVTAGRANADTLVRRDGETDWRPLEDFPELFTRAGELPPLIAAALPLANRSTRLAAAILDTLFAFLCLLPAIRLVGFARFAEILTNRQGSLASEDSTALASAGGAFLIGGLVLFAVQVVLLSRRGQSLGKLLLGIRIVRYRDSAPTGFTHAALLRWILPGLLGMIPFLGSFFSIIDVLFIFGPQKRCLHDLIADTKVVRCLASGAVLDEPSHT
ncbi:RDD family protein [Horticoccus luteus]|uniref:RDD family protein n=1 Tax=Horticoccus luteus TaxID=2862869 RepID=A0A8F9TW41_9BACT|nr:RDD family protein [Horticoccus luteus]QYM79205.1 RDD family protein [Horticoccus luteus]